MQNNVHEFDFNVEQVWRKACFWQRATVPQKSVERLGGSLSAQKDDDTWLVNVVIPLN